MQKTIKIVALFFACLLGASTGFTQIETARKLNKQYFRSDPLASTFSDFLAHLTKDPDLDNIIQQKKTDTSGYLFQGVYQKYNPFAFPDAKIIVQLAESVPSEDLSSGALMEYKLVTYLPDTEKNQQAMKKELNKIRQKYGKRLSAVKGETPAAAGEVYEFYPVSKDIPAYSIGWQQDTNNRLVFWINAVFVQAANTALLPGTFLPQRQYIDINDYSGGW